MVSRAVILRRVFRSILLLVLVSMASSSSSSVVSVTAATHFNITLTTQNYPIWRRHIHSTLIGLDLAGYITGDNTQPAKTITEKDTTQTNPAYTLWFRQDNVIFSAILGSCATEIQPLIASASTAKDAWDRLSASFASQSRSRIISLKSKLAKNPKGTRSVTEFLNEMRSIADDLAIAQSPVSEEDLMVHVLTQLGHSTKDCRKLARFLKENNISFASTKPQANAVNTTNGPSMWMMDSGASHHITSCPASLASVSDYGGPDEIILGDGSQNGGATHARGEHE